MLHGIAMVDHHTVCIEVSQVRVFHERTRLAFLPLLLLPTAVSVGSSQSIAQLRYKLYCYIIVKRVVGRGVALRRREGVWSGGAVSKEVSYALGPRRVA